LDLFTNGAHRASKLFRGARTLAMAALILGAGGIATVPTVAASTPIKVVIIVGPTGTGTASNIANAKQLAAQARSYGATVVEIYSPHAIWANVVAGAQGANILIDMGHGNGWPSPYGPFQENTKDGFGLNAHVNQGNLNVQYYGANYIRKYIHLAPNAVVILRGECYSAGNSEPGNPIPTVQGGRQRIQNFASGFLAVGAKAVFAEPYGDVGYILTDLFSGPTTAQAVFMSGGGGWGSTNSSMTLLPYPSQRTAGAHLEAYRDSTGHFRRSVTGFLTTTLNFSH
jgi:hypothetical protein